MWQLVSSNTSGNATKEYAIAARDTISTQGGSTDIGGNAYMDFMSHSLDAGTNGHLGCARNNTAFKTSPCHQHPRALAMPHLQHTRLNLEWEPLMIYRRIHTYN